MRRNDFFTCLAAQISMILLKEYLEIQLKIMN